MKNVDEQKTKYWTSTCINQIDIALAAVLLTESVAPFSQLPSITCWNQMNMPDVFLIPITAVFSEYHMVVVAATLGLPSLKVENELINLSLVIAKRLF